MRRTRSAAALLLGAALLAPTGCARDAPGPRIFAVHAIWFAGADAERGTLDRFLRCLVEGSNLNRYWREQAGVRLRGAWTLPPPPTQLDWHAVAGWLDGEVKAGRLPPPPPGESPLYLVFGGKPRLWVGACGRNGSGRVAGEVAALAIVRTAPRCWPGDTVRSLTQIATHEIVESVDRALGHGACAGGGTCRGRDICPDRCATFVGLACPGAPSATPTGCRGGRVDGWVVQRFAYAGRDPARCDRCAPCDFTPRVCGADEPRCAALPGAGR